MKHAIVDGSITFSPPLIEGVDYSVDYAAGAITLLSAFSGDVIVSRTVGPRNRQRAKWKREQRGRFRTHQISHGA